AEVRQWPWEPKQTGEIHKRRSGARPGDIRLCTPSEVFTSCPCEPGLFQRYPRLPPFRRYVDVTKTVRTEQPLVANCDQKIWLHGTHPLPTPLPLHRALLLSAFHSQGTRETVPPDFVNLSVAAWPTIWGRESAEVFRALRR